MTDPLNSDRWGTLVALLLARFGDQVIASRDIEALLSTRKVALVSEELDEDGQLSLRMRLVDPVVADEAARLHNKLGGGGMN